VLDNGGRVAQVFQGAVGVWWKFSRYELREGYLRPAPDAALIPYDPWAAYRAVRQDRISGTAPHETLLALMEEVGPGTYSLGPRPQFIVPPRAATAIVRWCETWGLLGLLPHCAQALVLPATWEPITLPDGQELLDVLFPAVTRYLRTPTGWRGQTQLQMGPEVPHVVGRPEGRGQLVAPEHLAATMPRPGVLFRELRDVIWTEAPIDQRWAPFFPEVPAAERAGYAYPAPLSEAFWHAYAEPLDAFVHAANTLREALAGLAHIPPFAEATADDKAAVGQAAGLLQTLIADVSPSPNVTPAGEIEPLWVSTSLLSSLAMMAFLDLSERKGRLLRCETCGTLFFSGAHQAKYCSERCRNRAQKRAYRKGLTERTSRGNRGGAPRLAAREPEQGGAADD
jgi:hypothetical protein